MKGKIGREGKSDGCGLSLWWTLVGLRGKYRKDMQTPRQNGKPGGRELIRAGEIDLHIQS